MNGETGKVLGMTFKREFGVGDLLQIVLLLLAVIGAYYNLSARIDLVELALANHVSNPETHETHAQKDARFYPRGELDAVLQERYSHIESRVTLIEALLSERLNIIDQKLSTIEQDVKTLKAR